MVIRLNQVWIIFLEMLGWHSAMKTCRHNLVLCFTNETAWNLGELKIDVLAFKCQLWYHNVLNLLRFMILFWRVSLIILY